MRSHRHHPFVVFRVEMNLLLAILKPPAVGAWWSIFLTISVLSFLLLLDLLHSLNSHCRLVFLFLNLELLRLGQEVVLPFWVVYKVRSGVLCPKNTLVIVNSTGKLCIFWIFQQGIFESSRCAESSRHIADRCGATTEDLRELFKAI